MKEIAKGLFSFLIISIFVLSSLCIEDGENEEDEEIIDENEPPVQEPLVKKGVLSSDEVWSGNIIVDEYVSVPSGVVLTIEPGTHVQFKHYRGYKEPWRKGNLMTNGGVIRAIGGEDGMIWFTSDAEDPINGDWLGINIRNSKRSVFRYVIVEYAVLGILQMDSNVEVSNSIIRWVNSEGLYAERSTPMFISNILYGNGYHDIALEQFNKNVTIEGNHFLGGHVSLHFEKTEAVVENNYFEGYRNPITGGMDSVVTVINNRFRDYTAQGPILFDKTVKATISGNDLGDDSVPVPSLDIVDIRETELDYLPGEPQDRFNYVYAEDDETRSVVQRMGKGLSFGWSLLYHNEYLWRFSLGHGTVGKQLDLIRINVETGNVVRFGNDVIMNPRGLTHDGNYFYVNDFSLLKIFKFQLNGTKIDIVDSFFIPDKEMGGTTGLTYDGTHLRLLSRDGKTLHKLQTNGSKVGQTKFERNVNIGTLVWTGSHFWSVNGGPKGLAKWDVNGKLVGSIYPVADGTWAIAYDGNHLWTLQRTCEEWNDDKIFKIEIKDDSLGEDIPMG